MQVLLLKPKTIRKTYWLGMWARGEMSGVLYVFGSFVGMWRRVSGKSKMILWIHSALTYRTVSCHKHSSTPILLFEGGFNKLGYKQTEVTVKWFLLIPLFEVQLSNHTPDPPDFLFAF